MQFIEVGKDVVDVEACVGSLGMPGQLCDLPTAELGENAAGQRIALLFEGIDFLADIDISIFSGELQLADLGFQLGNRLFKVEKERIQKGDVLTILELEQVFEYPLVVEGVGEILLKGKIDRIDRYNGVLRIIDYKSGNVDSAKLRISDWDVFKGDTKRLPLFQILLYSYVNKALLETEQTLVTGIISFKNMDAYVMPFGIKSKGKASAIEELNTEILSSFEEILIGLIQEIFDISKPFTSLEE